MASCILISGRRPPDVKVKRLGNEVEFNSISAIFSYNFLSSFQMSECSSLFPQVVVYLLFSLYGKRAEISPKVNAGVTVNNNSLEIRTPRVSFNR